MTIARFRIPMLRTDASPSRWQSVCSAARQTIRHRAARAGQADLQPRVTVDRGGSSGSAGNAGTGASGAGGFRRRPAAPRARAVRGRGGAGGTAGIDGGAGAGGTAGSAGKGGAGGAAGIDGSAGAGGAAGVGKGGRGRSGGRDGSRGRRSAGNAGSPIDAGPSLDAARDAERDVLTPTPPRMRPSRGPVLSLRQLGRPQGQLRQRQPRAVGPLVRYRHLRDRPGQGQRHPG